ncbi:MAG: hypothetical protein L3J39_08180 [Verrucomicrobiales bacterium]|nr:hypothetical protein [Verrucomicrobiales bacterium]
MAILLCSPQTASGKSMDSTQKTASGDFFVDELFYAAQIEPEPLNNGDWKWPSPTEIASDHAFYVANDPVNFWDPLGLDPLKYSSPAVKTKIDALRKFSPAFDEMVKAIESSPDKNYTAEEVDSYSDGTIKDGKIRFPKGKKPGIWGHNMWHAVVDAYSDGCERSKILPVVDPKNPDVTGSSKFEESEAQRANNIVQTEYLLNNVIKEKRASGKAMKNGVGLERKYNKTGWRVPIHVSNPLGYGYKFK